MDIVKLLSLVLCGFFFLGLFVVYELSLFDSELTTLMAQYARDEKTQTQVDTFVILQAKENTKQSKQAIKETDMMDGFWDNYMANKDTFWGDVRGGQNQQVIKDSRPIKSEHVVPKSRDG